MAGTGLVPTLVACVWIPAASKRPRLVKNHSSFAIHKAVRLEFSEPANDPGVPWLICGVGNSRQKDLSLHDTRDSRISTDAWANSREESIRTQGCGPDVIRDSRISPLSAIRKNAV